MLKYCSHFGKPLSPNFSMADQLKSNL